LNQTSGALQHFYIFLRDDTTSGQARLLQRRRLALSGTMPRLLDIKLVRHSLSSIRMAYRQTEKVVRKLAARREAIVAAAYDALAEKGIAAIQIAPIAERAGIAAGTVYRYFPSKTELVAAVVTGLSEADIAALEQAAAAAPGPLSALAAAIATFAMRAIARRRLVLALMAEPIEPDLDGALATYRRALAAEFEKLIRKALEDSHLKHQDAALAAPALIGALIEGLIGPLAPPAMHDPAEMRAQVQRLTLFALRALGVVDARARGLVVQIAVQEQA
jgi:AcrR family transcriptional regulator